MDMRISAQSSSPTGNVQWQQRQQNVKNLFAALKAGNLGSAQKAFNAITGGTGAVSANSPLASIGQALKNGDLAGAQHAAMQLQAQHQHQASPVGTPVATTAVAPITAPASTTALQYVTQSVPGAVLSMMA